MCVCVCACGCACPSHPVVREVFIDNLPHLCLLVVEDVRSKEEDDVEHGCLGGQGCAAVLGVGVGGYLEVREGGKEVRKHRDRDEEEYQGKKITTQTFIHITCTCTT